MAVPKSKARAGRQLIARAATALLTVLCGGLAIHAAKVRAADATAASIPESAPVAATNATASSDNSAVIGASDSSVAAPPVAAATTTQPQVTVAAPEPRFVAPTRRDRIGRIWAPVFIDGKGPFRLALDSCADTSGITKRVAQALGLPGEGLRLVKL